MAQKVLVADDDDAFRGWAEKTLSEAGYEVVGATDGEDALAKARSSGARVLLLDVVLPKLLGTEVCERLREADGPGSDVPVVFLVANEVELREVSAIDAEDARAEDILRKPMSADALLRVVKKWSSRTRIKGPVPGSERRRVPRVPTDIDSLIEETLDDDGAVVGPLPPSRVISISEGGAFVLTDEPLPEGTMLTLVFSVPGVEDAVRAPARVVYNRGGPEPGMGVVFVDLAEVDRSRIRLYVDLLRRVVHQ